MRKILFIAAMMAAARSASAGVAFLKSEMSFDYERRHEYGYARVNASDILDSKLLGTKGCLTSDCMMACRHTDKYDSCSSMFNCAEESAVNSLDFYVSMDNCGNGAYLRYSGQLGSDQMAFNWTYPKGSDSNGQQILNPVMSEAIAACNEIPVGELNNIKGVMTGAAVVSGIGAAGNLAASAGNIYGAVKNGQAAAGESADATTAVAAPAASAETAVATNGNGLKPGEAFKGQQMMNTITAGVGAAAGTTSTIINAASAGKLGKIIDQIEGCKSALGKVTAAASDTASLEEQMAASNSKSDAKSACNKISVSDIKNLKGAMVAAAVISGIGAAGNIASTAGNIVGAVKNTQEKKAVDSAAPTNGETAVAPGEVASGGLKPGESFKGQNIVNVASAGVGAATGAVSTAMSAAAAGKLDGIIAGVEKCRDAVSKL
ncbi:MAG: hypothetical protein LBL46_04140 [Rickettsiales bacterium]|nr:hypothetical protein [Rickettsiales bacterium]